MKCKFGAIVVDGRGKLGGHVASKNRAGSYFRTKVTPTNPGTTYQVNVRNRLSGLSSAWRGLTSAQRIAWNAAVGDFIKSDIFGDIRNPSGFNLHQKLNNNLVNIGEAPITTPPLPEAVDAFSAFAIAASFGGQTLTLVFSDAIAADHLVLFFATPGISAGIFFVKSEYRQIGVLDDGDASPLPAVDWYVDKYGAIPAEGKKIFVQLVQVNKTTGQAGIPIQASTIVIA